MKIAIIGSGVGGLTSALLLAKQGHKITIYEKQDKLGGRLTFQSSGPYKIDQGPTIILLPNMLKEILAEAGIREDELEMLPCEPLYNMHYPDGTTFTKYRDLARQMTEIETKFPGESPNFLRYMGDMSEVFHMGAGTFLNKAYHRKRDFLTVENTRLLLRSKAHLSVKKYISQYFENTKLQDAYALQSLYIGGSPMEASALYGLVSFSEHAHGIWYLKGGYGNLIPILEKACLEKGIRIFKNSPVEKILTENRTAKGIIVNGETHLYDAVVFNGDFPHLYQLVEGKKPLKQKKFKPSSGCVLAYAGVSKRYEQASIHQFFMSASFDNHMNQVFKTKEVPDDPSFYVFNPAALDDTAAPPGESVLYFLIPVPSGEHIDWENEKETLVKKVLEQAEKRLFTDLHSHIEWLDIRTPQDSIADGLYQGGSFGIAPTFIQSGGFRPQSASLPIERLYSVGASIHPGGGVPIVMQGAKLLSEYMKKELEA